jgi:hypothetical protein
MFKFSSFAIPFAAAFSWIAVSCAGPVTPGGSPQSPILASASSAGSASAPIIAAASPWNGSVAFLAVIAALFVLFGLGTFIFRGKTEMS